MDVLGRYRNLIVLVGVLFAQILGLAVQVNVKRTTDSEPTRLIRVWAVGMVTPFEKVLVWTQTSTSNLWHSYFYLRGVRAENRNLKAQIERMSLEQVRMSQDADQARRLQALLSFKEQFISRTMAAQVIGSSGSEQSRSVFIDKGDKNGIRTDMAVITADGVVGKVLRVYRSTAEVLLINDQSSGVGAILDKTRLQGILRGTPAGEVVLEKVMSDETVPPGEQVLTSGGDGIFPKGLLVGTVTKISPGSELFLNIHVRPAADLSKLEEVLVVTKIDERQAEPDQTSAARAVDILAERLPGVPSKPETPESSAAPGTGASAPKAPNAGPVVGAAKSATRMPKPANTDSAVAKPKAAAPQGSASGTVPAGKKTAAPVPSAAAGSTGGSASTSVKSSTPVKSSGTASGSPANALPSNTKTGASAPGTLKVAPKPAKPLSEPKAPPNVEDSPH
jgi:rod shape-determining protein MreC